MVNKRIPKVIFIYIAKSNRRLGRHKMTAVAEIGKGQSNQEKGKENNNKILNKITKHSPFSGSLDYKL